MCILTINYEPTGDRLLTVVANRDEFYKRESLAAHTWKENEAVFGGRDVEKGGSWLLVNNNGRFAAVTNYRDFSLVLVGEKSRGDIVSRFVTTDENAIDFMKAIKEEKDVYGPLNIILFDGENLVHYNNQEDEIHLLQEGIYTVSNATLDTPWPKLERMKALVKTALANDATTEELLAIGRDIEKPVDERLPNTGIGLEKERELSSIFVKMDDYGTRNSTVVHIYKDGQIDFFEQTYDEGEIGNLVEKHMTHS